MSKKYIISIPEPCNEKWDDMTPTKNGRFCDLCQTEILDFTNLTHQELAEKIKNDEPICAKYRPDQLDVDLYAQSDINLSRIVMAISLTTAVTLTQPAVAQNGNKNIQTEQTVNNNSKQKPIDSLNITIKGVVKDSTDGTPMPGVNVIIKGTNHGVATDFDGLFSLEIPYKKDELIVLIFSSVGYTGKEIVISKFNKPMNIELVQTEMSPREVIVLGGVVRRKTFFQRISDWFKRTFRRKKKEMPARSCEIKY